MLFYIFFLIYEYTILYNSIFMQILTFCDCFRRRLDHEMKNCKCSLISYRAYIIWFRYRNTVLNKKYQWIFKNYEMLFKLKLLAQHVAIMGQT